MISQSNNPITRPVIGLLTDFGSGDGTMGIMKGVIAGIAPQAHIIDITHEIAPQAVASGAWLLANAYRYFPARTVFVCVVDPGVGSSRGAIALHAGSWFFVGPDNGLFGLVLNEQPLRGAVALTNPAYHLSHVSSTFHGRDIFAPVGAFLANNPSKVFPLLGTALDAASLQPLAFRPASRQDHLIEGHVLHVDHFGNLITSIPLTLVPELFTASHVRMTFQQQRNVTITLRRRFFADGVEDEQAFLYSDSSGYIGVAIRNGNASSTLGIGYGAPLCLTIATEP